MVLWVYPWLTCACGIFTDEQVLQMLHSRINIKLRDWCEKVPSLCWSKEISGFLGQRWRTFLRRSNFVYYYLEYYTRLIKYFNISRLYLRVGSLLYAQLSHLHIFLPLETKVVKFCFLHYAASEFHKFHI